MARIRSIKPEFWSSPNLPDDPWARLLFIAMWNWADDNGVGTANPREILGFAFPNDEHLTVVDLRRMLEEIRRGFGVVFYEVAGRPYYSIPSWEKHQKFDRRSSGKYPKPEEAESQVSWMKPDNSTESHESTSSARRDSVAGTGEEGNRGRGEQGKETHSTLNVSTDRARELSERELEDVIGVVRDELAVDIDMLTAATFAEFILEPATMPVENPVAYIRVAVVRTPGRASGLLREAERQVAKVRVAS